MCIILWSYMHKDRNSILRAKQKQMLARCRRLHFILLFLLYFILFLYFFILFVFVVILVLKWGGISRHHVDCLEGCKQILGLIENMSFFKCPNCGERSHVFGHGGARATAKEMGIDFLGEVNTLNF